ncbi:MAG: hypothetical protein KDD77_03680, partial [Caldilineaceae bacterium]|nr:hypothetical protein [Caldilineaceae bacterium]
QVRATLLSDETGSSDSGYGLLNVNQRIRLYYGQRYGLQLSSVYGAGTTVSLTIPLRSRPKPVSEES